MLVKIKNIAMANILLGETIVDELIQNDVNSIKIYEACKKLLANSTNYEKIKTRLGEIKNKLGNSGASKRTAELILAQLNEAK
jgi:lipid-A-disaccharide synthase